jgi:myb proto-oncogene protein
LYQEINLLDELVPNGILPSNSTWNTIAKHFHGRTAKQCRERYHSHHSLAERKRGNWTAEEDKIIATMSKKIGNKWAKIAALMPGRTENDVKASWKGALG